MDNSEQQTSEALSVEERFRDTVALIAAKITEVEQHPEADKLYIERLDDGSEEGRTIVSGLVPHYRPDELLGRTIIVVSNLKPAKLRGVKSEGMLLAASARDGEGPDAPEIVDVLFVDHVEPGTRLFLEGYEPSPSDSADAPATKRIKIDDFFAIPIMARNGTVSVGSARLMAGDRPVTTTRVSDGSVG
jgi:methionyl-tRNA synthetase